MCELASISLALDEKAGVVDAGSGLKALAKVWSQDHPSQDGESVGCEVVAVVRFRFLMPFCFASAVAKAASNSGSSNCFGA